MGYEVLATPAVLKRVRRAPGPIADEIRERIVSLGERIPDGPPDRAAVWKRAFPDLLNHRHVNLRDGWRLCFTIERAPGTPPRVVLVFLGTHKEYERTYGFKVR